MNNLALTLRYQGRWVEAEKLQKKVLETSKVILGEDHPGTLTAMGNLALTLRDQGRWVQAEKLQRNVLETCKTFLGEDHPGPPVLSYRLSNMHYGCCYSPLTPQPRPNLPRRPVLHHCGLNSNPLQQRSQPQILHHNIPHRFLQLHASLHAYLAVRPGQASATETRKALLSEDHSDTLTTMNNLTLTLQNHGTWDEAENLQKTVLETLEILLSEDQS
ncbi:hypothetical protein FPQ18DRAFT_412067 [Pyronema domesticum]|nr:hypothetical protein FPQ18DRAFT_412067 [Pyronema domesticum]